MEPDPEGPDDHAGGEEDAQDAPTAAAEAHERDASADEKQRGVSERKPRDPGFAEHLAMLEAHFGEEKRAPRDGRGSDQLVSCHAGPPCAA